MMNTISTFRSALLAATLAFTPLTAALHAQTAEHVHVNVPFSFQNGSETLPAGLYTLTMTTSNIFTIQGKNEGGVVVSRREGGSDNISTGKVVFQRIGDKYFLREVWQPGKSTHTVCIQTRAEKKAMQAVQDRIAAGNTPATTVTIATK
jgi:hypothetical protein